MDTTLIHRQGQNFSCCLKIALLSPCYTKTTTNAVGPRNAIKLGQRLEAGFDAIPTQALLLPSARLQLTVAASC